MTERPICFSCAEPVDVSHAVFESACGHDECPSAVFHGVCLMEWRERRSEDLKRLGSFLIDLATRMGDIRDEWLNEWIEENDG